MRLKLFLLVGYLALFPALITGPAGALGKPGITPSPCGRGQWEATDPTFQALAGAKAYFGKYDGGVYHIEIPDKWNGELMLSAHGYVAAGQGRGQQLRVGMPAFRQHLIDEGFAWAASSYRCNGYVPGIGLVDTMALTDLFTKANGGTAPRRVYLTGGSMGGHVTLLGMHEFPTAFAGGLAMCPSGPELFDFTAAVGAAAEVVTGIQFKQGSTPDDLAKMRALLGEPPNYTEKGRQLASIEISLSGGPRPFAVEGLASRFYSNISSGPLVGTPRQATNEHIKYAIEPGLGLTADALDRSARRAKADPAIRNPDGPYEELVPFDGRIERPLLTMHGTGDLYVPIHLQQILNRAVNAAGRGDLLVQRAYRIPGHCGFNAQEQARSFDDLVKWVREGVKPAGDNIFGDLRDAGRVFTNPLRPNDPGTIGMAAK
jgi:pimeloyl-ACP methyl ester carboxylesterase